jgi:YEATS domain-containing protein 4
VLNKPPFEVQETGWGEFEIQIKLFFVDPNEKPASAVLANNPFICS